MAKKKRKKARTPYQTYKYWYQNYERNNVMKYPLLKYHDFRREYNSQRDMGVNNPARTIARESKKYSYAQTHNYKRVLRNINDGKIARGGVDFKQKIIQVYLNQKDEKTGEPKYFDAIWYMGLSDKDKIEYMGDVINKVRRDIKSINLKEKNQIGVQNSFADILKVLHDGYNMSYQEIFSPKEK